MAAGENDTTCNSGLVSVDCTRTGMLGHSLGGGVAMNIAVAHPDLADAIVLYAPVSTHAWENFDRWRRERDESDRTVAVLGDDRANDAWTALSSAAYLDRLAAPVLVFHGDADADVPQIWSDALVARLRELGKDVEDIEYAGEKHEFINRWPDFLQRTAAFLQAMP